MSKQTPKTVWILGLLDYNTITLETDLLNECIINTEFNLK